MTTKFASRSATKCFSPEHPVFTRYLIAKSQALNIQTWVFDHPIWERKVRCVDTSPIRPPVPQLGYDLIRTMKLHQC